MKSLFISVALLSALSLAGCDAKLALAQAKMDILTVEQGLAVGSVAFCAALPALQADADAVISAAGVAAKVQADVAAGKAAAAVVCANPTATNLRALAAKVAAAKASVSAALAAGQ